MDHAWQDNAALVPPTPPASFSVGYPQGANTSTGQQPTHPGPWMWYAIVEELRNLIIASGQTPNPTAVNQITLAVQHLIAAAGGGGGSGAVSPLAYGCVGDGVTDDTAGMFACFAAAQGKVIDGGGLSYKLNMTDVAHTSIVDVTALGSSFTASFAPTGGSTTTTTMTVTGSPTHPVLPNQRLTPTGNIPVNVSVISQLTGGAGGAGTYLVNGSFTQSSTSVVSTVGYGAGFRWFLAHGALTIRNMNLIGNVSYQGHNPIGTNGYLWNTIENVTITGDARWASVWSIISRCNVTGTSWPGSDYPPTQNAVGFFYNIFQSSQLGLWRPDFRYGWENDNTFIQCRFRNIQCVNTSTSDVGGVTGWSAGEALGFHKNNWISCEVFCAAAAFTGSLAPLGSGTSTLTVTSMTAGSPLILPESQLVGAGIPAGVYVISQATGTTGGVGTYVVNRGSLTVSSEAMTATDAINYAGTYGSGSFAVVMEDLFYNQGANTLGTNWLDIYDEGNGANGVSTVYGGAWILKDLQLSGGAGLVNAGNMGWTLPLSGMLCDNAAYRAVPSIVPAGSSFVGGDWSILNSHGYPYCIYSPSIVGVVNTDTTEPSGLGKSVTFAMAAGQAIWFTLGAPSGASLQLSSFCILMKQTSGNPPQWQTQDINGNPVYGAVTQTLLGNGWALYYGSTNGNQIQLAAPVSGAWTVVFGTMSAGRGGSVIGPAARQQGGKPLIDLSNGVGGSLFQDALTALLPTINEPPFRTSIAKTVTSVTGGTVGLFTVQLAAYQTVGATVQAVVTLYSASGGARVFTRSSTLVETGGAALVESGVATVNGANGAISGSISGTTLTIGISSSQTPSGTVETIRASVLVNGVEVTVTAL